jgi:oligopeptide/dipeptide ABC transporter ATP-binding protein
MPTARRRLERLPVIPGLMPAPGSMPSGCRFHPRCPDAIDKCRTQPPPVVSLEGGHVAHCWRADELQGAVP